LAYGYALFIGMSVVLWSGRDEQKPNNDLFNQEKNQYWTVYWGVTGTLCTQGRDQEWSEVNGS